MAIATRARASARFRAAGAIAAFLIGAGACSADDAGSGSTEWTTVETTGDVLSVVALGDGFVATMASGDTCEILYSADAAAWSVVETDATASGECLSWMTGGAYGAAGEILGAERPEIVVTTDGATFTRTDPFRELDLPESGIIGMGWGPAGLAVVLSRGGQPMGLVASTDGRTWHRGALPADVIDFGDPGIPPLAASAHEYVLRGIPESEGNPGFQAWRSPDLVTWQAEQISPEFIGALDAPVAWSGGYVISGATVPDVQADDPRFIGAAWERPTPDVWEALDASGLDLDGGLIVVTGSALGVFAVAWRESMSDMDVLFSPDLDTWSTWTMREAFDTGDPGLVGWGGAAMGASAAVVPVAGDLRVLRP